MSDDVPLEDKIAWYFDHPVTFMEERVRIRDRNGQIVPLKLNYPQLVLHSILEKQRKEFGYVRTIVCKARRLGISTYVEARYYHHSSLRPGVHVYIVSHRDDSCDVLFNMAKLMQEANPKDELHPNTRKSNKKELLFTHRSQYALSSADSPGAAKSRDITLFHGSEVAEWRAADDLLSALLPCLPTAPIYSEAILESTAKGYGNLFQRWCFEAYAEGAYPYFEHKGFTYAWKNPKFDWVLVFFPWFRHPDYKRSFDNADMMERFKAEIRKEVFKPELGVHGPTYEKELMDEYGLDLESVNWYVHTRRNDYNDSFDDMREQYPSTLLESFVTTGGNVFPAGLCDDLEKRCTDAIEEGELVEREGKVKLRHQPKGRCRIWESPQQGVQYLISIDPAGGKKEHQEDKNRPDYTCMDVWRRTDKYLYQVAQWRGHIDFDLISDVAVLLGKMYNRADFATLRMNHGLTVIAGLRKEYWPRIVQDDDRQDGLNEDRKRKPQMVDTLVEYCRDGYVVFRNKESIKELRTYILRDGKYGAEDGCKDDRVSSAYAACYADQFMPRPKDHSTRPLPQKPGDCSFVNWQRYMETKFPERRKSNAIIIEVP